MLLFTIHGVSIAHGDIVSLSKVVVDGACPDKESSFSYSVVGADHNVWLVLPEDASVQGVTLCYNHGPAATRHYADIRIDKVGICALACDVAYFVVFEAG